MARGRSAVGPGRRGGGGDRREARRARLQARRRSDGGRGDPGGPRDDRPPRPPQPSSRRPALHVGSARASFALPPASRSSSAVGRRRNAIIDLLASRFHGRLGYAWWFERGKLATLWTHLRSLNLAERYPPGPEMAQAYSEHAPAMMLLPWHRRGIRFAQRSHEIRVRLGDRWGQGQSLHFWGAGFYAASEFDRSLERMREALELLESTGDQWEVNNCRLQIAMALYRLGDLPGAAEMSRMARKAGLEIGDAQARGIGLEGWAKATDGIVPEELIRAEIERSSEDLLTLASVRQAEGVRLLAVDDPDGAIRSFDESQRLFRHAGMKNAGVSPVRPWLLTALRRAAESAPPAARRAAPPPGALRSPGKPGAERASIATTSPTSCGNARTSPPSRDGVGARGRCSAEAWRWRRSRGRGRRHSGRGRLVGSSRLADGMARGDRRRQAGSGGARAAPRGGRPGSLRSPKTAETNPSGPRSPLAGELHQIFRSGGLRRHRWGTHAATASGSSGRARPQIGVVSEGHGEPTPFPDPPTRISGPFRSSGHRFLDPSEGVGYAEGSSRKGMG